MWVCGGQRAQSKRPRKAWKEEGALEDGGGPRKMEGAPEGGGNWRIEGCPGVWRPLPGG